MKKIFRSVWSILLIIGLAFSMSACGNNGQSSSSDTSSQADLIEQSENPSIESELNTSSSVSEGSNSADSGNSMVSSRAVSSNSSSIGSKYYELQYNPRKVRSELFYGICEPIVSKSAQMGVDIEKSLKALKALGAKSIRMGVNPKAVLASPTKLDTNNNNYKNYSEFFKNAKRMGIEVVVDSGFVYLPESFLKKYPKADSYTIPHRDLKEGSDYMQFLKMGEQAWETMVKAFPDVMYWEIGNELNMDGVFHPIEWIDDKSKPFSDGERAAIITDMMYYASKGIHKGNPHALVVMPGWAPAIKNRPDSTFDGIAQCMEAIYKNIKSGKWPSQNPDDFFQIGCWHAYNWDAKGLYEDPSKNFVAKNNKVYDIMKKYGDDGKKVIISEFGYSDGGSATEDEKLAGYMTTAYSLAKKHMPYIETIHYFRMFEDTPARSWGGDVEIYFGLFKEPENGFTPKARAYAYQKMAGGKGNLKGLFTIDPSTFKPGDNIARGAIVKASSSCENVDWGWNKQFLVDGKTRTSGWTVWYYPSEENYWVKDTPGGGGAKSQDSVEWVQVTLPGTFEIDKVELYAAYMSYLPEGQRFASVPIDWKVQISTDEKTWTTVGTVSNYTGRNKEVFSFSFAKKKAKYVRVYITKLAKDHDPKTGDDNWLAKFSEMMVYMAK